jgi:putative FmdB family regulatory protein
MPIYEYRCGSCGHELEALQKISDAPLSDCPACGEPNLAKQVSAAGFRLKGGGWYETDYKAGKKKNLAGDAGAPAKSDAAGKAAGGSSAAGAA